MRLYTIADIAAAKKTRTGVISKRIMKGIYPEADVLVGRRKAFSEQLFNKILAIPDDDWMARKKELWSQNQLANKLGLDQATFSYRVLCKRYPAPDVPLGRWRLYSRELAITIL